MNPPHRGPLVDDGAGPGRGLEETEAGTVGIELGAADGADSGSSRDGGEATELAGGETLRR